MTKTIIKTLFQKPSTTKYPFAPRKCIENSRGSISMTITNCIFCGLCQRKCPTNAKAVDKQQRTWEIERLRCITCNSCVEVCPKKCLKMENQYTEPSYKKIRDEYARVSDNKENH
jgi:formate hydrogenlyase subunit 6/NADH:ubiquinone oxidoreductase subunit I